MPTFPYEPTLDITKSFFCGKYFFVNIENIPSLTLSVFFKSIYPFFMSVTRIMLKPFFEYWGV
ncbi:hypothetical protein HmCmsJML084_02136 [Escherichia coli]|nr:hypothetical protein HmCmsJML084_02136 [Escherichia coli]